MWYLVLLGSWLKSNDILVITICFGTLFPSQTLKIYIKALLDNSLFWLVVPWFSVYYIRASTLSWSLTFTFPSKMVLNLWLYVHFLCQIRYKPIWLQLLLLGGKSQNLHGSLADLNQYSMHGVYVWKFWVFDFYLASRFWPHAYPNLKKISTITPLSL